MIINTISTLGIAKRMSSTLNDLQIDLLKTNDEIASGKHFDMAKTLGSRTGQDIALRNIYDQNEQDLQICSLYQGKLGSMDTALTAILKAGQDVQSQAATGLGGKSAIGSSLSIAAKGVLDQITGLLNASAGNDYLFGGIAVTTVPMRNVDGDASGLRSPMQIVKDAITAATGGSPIPNTAADTTAVIATLDDLFNVRTPGTPAPAPLTDTFEGGLYSGTTELTAAGTAQPRSTARVDDASTIGYGIQANDPPFRSLLEGLYMLSAVDPSKLNEQAYPGYITAAVQKITSGLDGVREATANLGVQRAQIDNAVTWHETQKKLLSEHLNAFEGIDDAEASTRLSQIQAQIEAASMATSQIAKMRLTNYL